MGGVNPHVAISNMPQIVVPATLKPTFIQPSPESLHPPTLHAVRYMPQAMPSFRRTPRSSATGRHRSTPSPVSGALPRSVHPPQLRRQPAPAPEPVRDVHMHGSDLQSPADAKSASAEQSPPHRRCS